jgi:outer membrane putative beta-barrel porin/alpha-amylase
LSLRKVLLACVVLFAFAPGGARAQGTLAELLPRLLSESVTMPSTAGNVAGNPHEAHFLPAAAQIKAPYALNSAIVSQLATFPLGSSSGGFTYSSDTPTGIPQRSSTNFGPAFAERALTIGRGKFSAGVNYQHVRFDHFDGLALDGGPRFYLQHNDCCPIQNPDGTPNPGATVGPSHDLNPFFEGDLVRDDLRLDVTTDTVAFFGNYGLTGSLDVGVAIPVVSVNLDATMTSTIIRLATSSNPLIHTFGGSSPDTKVSHEAGSKTGLGDILLRAKYNFLKNPGGGLAAGLDLRLPTGDESALLGTGATQVKLSLIYSSDIGRVAPHLNLGYTISSGQASAALGTYALGNEVPTPTQPAASNAYNTVFRGQTPGSALSKSDLEVPDEIDFRAGLVVSLSPRITFATDFVGRTLRSVNRFGVVSKDFNYRTANNAPVQTATYADAVDITTSSGNLTLLLGTAGFKVNIARTLLLNVNVLFPLNDAGLRPKVTPVVGIDYAF